MPPTKKMSRASRAEFYDAFICAAQLDDLRCIPPYIATFWNERAMIAEAISDRVVVGWSGVVNDMLAVLFDETAPLVWPVTAKLEEALGRPLDAPETDLVETVYLLVADELGGVLASLCESYLGGA